MKVLVVKKRDRKKRFDLEKYGLRGKQPEFVAALFSGEADTPKEAALMAGYSHHVADNAKYLLINKNPNVRRAITDIMDAMGLHDEALLTPIVDALQANKVLSAKVIVQGGGENADATSVTDDFIDVPDHKVRLKAAEMGLRLRGHMAQQVDVTHTTESFEERLKRLRMVESIDAEYEEK